MKALSLIKQNDFERILENFPVKTKDRELCNLPEIIMKRVFNIMKAQALHNVLTFRIFLRY